jgi:hypothetical protein
LGIDGPGINISPVIWTAVSWLHRIIPLTEYSLEGIIKMTWEVEVSEEFREWYVNLTVDLRAAIAAAVDTLEEAGPDLGRPVVDTLKGSRYPNMKELRVQHRGRPYRILFIFDPRRKAYLILGGDKSGNPQWYEQAIRRAERIYAQHLRETGES